MDSLVNESISCLLPATKAASDNNLAQNSKLAGLFAEVVLTTNASNCKIPSFYKGLFERGRKLGSTFPSSTKEPVSVENQKANSRAEDAIVNQLEVHDNDDVFCFCLMFAARMTLLLSLLSNHRPL